MDNRKKMAELEEKYDMKTGCLPMRTSWIVWLGVFAGFALSQRPLMLRSIAIVIASRDLRHID